MGDYRRSHCLADAGMVARSARTPGKVGGSTGGASERSGGWVTWLGDCLRVSGSQAVDRWDVSRSVGCRCMLVGVSGDEHGGFSVSRLTDQHFAGLLGVRSAIAVFERTGEREARSAGATHAQHHVLLALRGHRDREDAPTVKDVAAALGVASPSAVELIGRMVGAGLLERRPDGRDARLTRLHLTALGQRLVTELSEGHLPRLRELTRRGVELLRD